MQSYPELIAGDLLWHINHKEFVEFIKYIPHNCNGNIWRVRSINIMVGYEDQMVFDTGPQYIDLDKSYLNRKTPKGNIIRPI